MFAQHSVAGFPLIDDQIETGRKLVAVNGAQQCVGLATVVRLVIEKMIERGGQYLFDILRIDDGSIADCFGQIFVGQVCNESSDTIILRAPR